MAQFDGTQYSVLMGFNGSAKTQEHLITLTGNSGEGVLLYFTTNGAGSVQVDSPTNATGFFPIERYQETLESIKLFMANGGAVVSVDEVSNVIRFGTQGTLP